MSFTVEDKSRVGRKAYWTAFVVNISLIVGLTVGCVVAAIGGHFAVAILAFLLIAPVAIYFRVVMMRRCRDIGWPAFLPWALMGAGIVANLARLSQGVEALRNPSTGLLPALVSLIDFAFMIAIGCIGTKSRSGDYARQFFDEDDLDEVIPVARPAMPQAAARVPQGYDAQPALRSTFATREAEEASWDAAIARALEAHQRGEGEVQSRRPLAPPVQRPAPGLHRPTSGFGRRVI